MFEWRSHLAHNEGIALLEADNRLLFVSTAGILLPNEATEITKINGLSDIGISAVHFYAEKNLLLIGYDNGNIEIAPISMLSSLSANQNILITDIKNDGRYDNKRINRFVCSADRCVAATGFGIVEFDAATGEIHDNFTIHPAGNPMPVHDLLRYGSKWIAATDTGIFACETNNPQWFHFREWQQMQTGSGFHRLAVYDDTLFMMRSDGCLLRTTIDFQRIDTISQGIKMLWKEKEQEHENLWIATSSHLHKYPDAQNNQIIDIQGFSPQSVITSGGALWLADSSKGLWRYDGNGFSPQMQDKQPLGKVMHIVQHNGRMWAAGNGFLCKHWQNTWECDANPLIINPVALAIDPRSDERLWVATPTQVIEYQDVHTSKAIFSTENVRAAITAMDVANNGDILIACANAAPTLNLLYLCKNNVHCEPLATDISGILAGSRIRSIAHFGNVFRGITDETQSIIFAYQSSPERFIAYPIKLRNDYQTTATTAFALTADRAGEMWLGTNKGATAYSVGGTWDESAQARKIQTQSDMAGYVSYLLEYEQITTIAIDGGNRKWFGTAASGVLLQSANGYNPLLRYNAANSPLPSDHILSMAVNSATGAVFFATQRGMLSFTADATAGAESFSDIKIYPNPVRPNMQNVTLTGLTEDAEIKLPMPQDIWSMPPKPMAAHYCGTCKPRRATRRRQACMLYLWQARMVHTRRWGKC
jgi:ligand-binding sensor domain-containing protein